MWALFSVLLDWLNANTKNDLLHANAINRRIGIKNKQIWKRSKYITFVLHAKKHINKSSFPRCQFHQHFIYAFLPIFWCQKISNPKHSFVIFGTKILYEKHVWKTLMKLTEEHCLNITFTSTLVAWKEGCEDLRHSWDPCWRSCFRRRPRIGSRKSRNIFQSIWPTDFWSNHSIFFWVQFNKNMPNL